MRPSMECWRRCRWFMGLERTEDWETQRTATLTSLSPERHLENLLAKRVALQLWRLHRAI
jgi:hypothetical protein